MVKWATDLYEEKVRGEEINPRRGRALIMIMELGMQRKWNSGNTCMSSSKNEIRLQHVILVELYN